MYLRRLALKFLAIVVASQIFFSISQAQGRLSLIGTIDTDTVRSQFGYRIVGVGDQNNDGYDDFLASELVRGNWLFLGGPMVSQTPAMQFKGMDRQMNAYFPVGQTRAKNLILYHRQVSPLRFRLHLFDGGTNLDTIPEVKLGSVASHPVFGGLYCGDLNGDGTPEVIAQEFQQRELMLFALTANPDSNEILRIRPFTYPGYGTYGEAVISGDFNSDGWPDICTNVRYAPAQQQSGRVLCYFGGPAFDTLPDLTILPLRPYQELFDLFGSLGRLVSPGDINGDGIDDIVEYSGGGHTDTTAFIYFGGAGIDSIPDLEVFYRHNRCGWAGDVNADGHNDILFALAPSVGGAVGVLLGGPNMDNVVDYTFGESGVPGLQDEFGQGITGIGDYNGDGVNDIAFSAVESNSQSRIYIFSGILPPTDVEEDEIVPTATYLNQNYPNPFNPSTTISFSVPSSSHVTLQIFNSIGEIVRTLVDQRLSAGGQTTQWDGTTDSGSRVASGTYFYQLSIDGVRSAKKMVLLK